MERRQTRRKKEIKERGGKINSSGHTDQEDKRDPGVVEANWGDQIQIGERQTKEEGSLGRVNEGKDGGEGGDKLNEESSKKKKREGENNLKR